ncbi:MAG: arylsulfatase [Acidobacteria bacterium]|nr:arylsulfatase [Acidobacteriota bacterium]
MGGAAALLGASAEAQSPAKKSTHAVAAPRPANADGRPNILMIMADQLRVDCVGAYGNKRIHTPHLDRIAREGLRFENAYTSVPSCTPARSALLTGLSPWKHGMLGMTKMATKPYPVEKAHALAQAGYYTTVVGKNHYYPITNPHGYHHMITDEHCSYAFHKRDNKPKMPQSEEIRCDYESWFWSEMPDKDPHATGLGWNDHGARPWVHPEETHPTHWTGSTAVKFIEQYEREQPFFLKVSFIRPHSPYDPPKRLYDFYDKQGVPEAKAGAWAKKYEPRSWEGDDIWHGKLPPDQMRNARVGYYGSVTHVDEQIGRILVALEERKMLDNTLILFFSDHGDMLGDQNMWRKTYAYEQSAHIPMLMRPAASMQLSAKGAAVRGMVEIRDVVPTLLDVAGAPIPESIEGKSLLQLVKSKGEGWREWIDLEHNICYDETNHWNALTDGEWKYIFHAFDGHEQLFNLQNDPDELNDLGADAARNAELERWRGRMVAHLSERGEHWVKDGKLQVRKKGTMLGPNFPGYLEPEMVLKSLG